MAALAFRERLAETIHSRTQARQQTNQPALICQTANEPQSARARGKHAFAPRRGRIRQPTSEDAAIGQPVTSRRGSKTALRRNILAAKNLAVLVEPRTSPTHRAVPAGLAPRPDTASRPVLPRHPSRQSCGTSVVRCRRPPRTPRPRQMQKALTGPREAVAIVPSQNAPPIRDQSRSPGRLRD
jgi:hypothetical protein